MYYYSVIYTVISLILVFVLFSEREKEAGTTSLIVWLMSLPILFQIWGICNA